MSDPQLMIFGASTRAAAESAVRASYTPLCADLFVDEDLREIAQILPLENYPRGLIRSVSRAPNVPWIYTGALENRPALLDTLARHRPLLGNSGGIVRSVRNPFRLHEVLELAGLPTLDVRPENSPPVPNGQWMLKPIRGAAGRGICVWDSAGSVRHRAEEPIYFQQRAGGRPISALYLATGVETELIGLTEQLIGLEALFARPFAYCGSVGPITVANSVETQLRHTGQVIARDFGLCGLFGVDFLLDGQTAWPTEVNPRYTASVEIYEIAWGLPLLGWHWRACASPADISAAERTVKDFRQHLDTAQSQRRLEKAARAIVFAPFSFVVPNLAEIAASRAFTAHAVRIADRPSAGATVNERTPVCTLLASTTAPATERWLAQELLEPVTPLESGLLSSALRELVGQLEKNRL